MTTSSPLVTRVTDQLGALFGPVRHLSVIGTEHKFSNLTGVIITVDALPNEPVIALRAGSSYLKFGIDPEEGLTHREIDAILTWLHSPLVKEVARTSEFCPVCLEEDARMAMYSLVMRSLIASLIVGLTQSHIEFLQGNPGNFGGSFTDSRFANDRRRARLVQLGDLPGIEPGHNPRSGG